MKKLKEKMIGSLGQIGNPMTHHRHLAFQYA
jgi:hypothetical protein